MGQGARRHLLATATRLTAEMQVRRGDWFATHPFSPLRLKAAELCVASEVMTDGGTPRATLESEVQDLMAPSYLTAKTDTAETMRRLLFAGGVAVVCAEDGTAAPEAIAELERLLGPGALPHELKLAVILADVPSRIGQVRATVPPLRCAQGLRDLCVIAWADGYVSAAEIDVVRDIAMRVEVDLELVSCVLDSTSDGCASSALP